MFNKKILISIATVAAIVAPLVPKTVNLNITMEQPSKKEKSYRSVETVCDIKTKTISISTVLKKKLLNIVLIKLFDVLFIRNDLFKKGINSAIENTSKKPQIKLKGINNSNCLLKFLLNKLFNFI